MADDCWSQHQLKKLVKNISDMQFCWALHELQAHMFNISNGLTLTEKDTIYLSQGSIFDKKLILMCWDVSLTEEVPMCQTLSEIAREIELQNALFEGLSIGGASYPKLHQKSIFWPF